MDRPVELSVIVPAYREGKRIYENITRLLTELDRLDATYEVVVVSDGNTDSTLRETKRVISPRLRVFHYPMNVGKGFALSLGVDQCVGDLVTFIDADMELDPANIKTFIETLRNASCDAVIGSKRHPQSHVAYPALRRFQSSVYQLLVRLLFHLNITDTQAGLKLFRRDVLAEVIPLLAIKRFAFDLELLVVARFLGYRKICEAPISLDYQFESTVNLRSAFDVLWDTAAIFYRLRVVRYYERRSRELEIERHALRQDLARLTPGA
ncbi:MAG TPA: glycosyltransferase [Blastocatellia bacterium]|jgi:glycosyltransferase involved in cell wall biosynthesis|nr:glycosyltransferase [Blastocatellia bacterium]